MDSFYIIRNGEFTLSITEDLGEKDHTKKSLMNLQDARSKRTIDLMKFSDWSFLAAYDVVFGREFHQETCICTSDDAVYYRCPKWVTNYLKTFNLLEQLTCSAAKTHAAIERQRSTATREVRQHAQYISGYVFSKMSTVKAMSIKQMDEDVGHVDIELLAKPDRDGVCVSDSVEVRRKVDGADEGTVRSLGIGAGALQIEQGRVYNVQRLKGRKINDFNTISKVVSNMESNNLVEDVKAKRFEKALKRRRRILNKNSELHYDSIEEMISSKAGKDDHTKQSLILTIPRAHQNTETNSSYMHIDLSQYIIQNKGPSSIHALSQRQKQKKFDSLTSRQRTEFSSFETQHSTSHRQHAQSMYDNNIAEQSDSRIRLKKTINPLSDIIKRSLHSQMHNDAIRAKMVVVKHQGDLNLDTGPSKHLSKMKQDRLIYDRFPNFPQLKSASDQCLILNRIAKKLEDKKTREVQRKRIENLMAIAERNKN